MRTFAMGLSPTLIKSTPASLSWAAPRIALLGFEPFGGSISTLITKSLRLSFAAKFVSGSLDRDAATGTGRGRAETTGAGRETSRGIAARIAWMWAGVVPQQPPTIVAPESTASRAKRAKYSDVAR